MYLETPPRLIETRVFSTMPGRLPPQGCARPTGPTPIVRARTTDSFIEGPSFDADGNLHVVDIPFGRIFRIAPGGEWSLVIEYDGWPNGLKIAADGRILVADYKHGIMELDAKAGRMQPLLTARNSESFRGLQRSASGREWRHLFHRPGTDRAARSHRAGLSAVGERPARLPDRYRHQPQRPGAGFRETVLFVAMTRDNAVWRLPLMKDGSVSKVGRFCSTFGTSGPDGMTMDGAGRLFVAHASLGHVFVFAPNGELIARIKSCAGPACTNVAIGGNEQRPALHHGVGDRHGAGRGYRCSRPWRNVRRA